MHTYAQTMKNDMCVFINEWMNERTNERMNNQVVFGAQKAINV